MDKIYTNIKERVLYYAKYKGISVESFLSAINMTYGSFKGKAKLGSLNSDAIEKILTIHVELNSEWLLTGKGEMLKEDICCSSNNDNIPLYNAEASAGIGELLLEKEHIVSSLHVPFSRPEDIALTIVGDSMSPAIASGDIAVVRNMPNWIEYLDFGNIFIIITESEVYCKIISRNINNELLTMRSINTNYDDFEIPKRFITKIYKVIGTVCQRSY